MEVKKGVAERTRTWVQEDTLANFIILPNVPYLYF